MAAQRITTEVAMTFYVVRAFDEHPDNGALVERCSLLCSSPDDAERVAMRVLREGAVGAVGYRDPERRRGPPVVVFLRGRVPHEWTRLAARQGPA